MTPEINDLLIRESTSLKQALSVIDHNAQGICFITNVNGQLTGILTDGDIRRALLNGAALDTPIISIMRRDFVSLPYQSTDDAIRNKLKDPIKHIPLVDSDGVPVDYASSNRLRRIPVMQPSLDGNELAYVMDCVKTGWISSQGSYVRKFEADFAKYCGAPYALAVSNGTVAIHLALVALGIGPGDEVIVPDYTFAASINAIIYTGATPVLVDVDRETWTIDVQSVQQAITPNTKAIMPVHIYGHPADMKALNELAFRHRLLIIEDCAEALGSYCNGKHVGTECDAGTFSFFGNKTITTGEGGMVLFKDDMIYQKALVLRDHGMSKTKRYWHDFVGFNYRLTNLQAAIGVAQLEKIDQFLAAKRMIAQKYTDALGKYPGVIPPAEKPWARNSYWLYTFLLDDSAGLKKEELMEKLLKNGVETRPGFFPLHKMDPYKKYCKGQSFPNSKFVSENSVSLPSSVSLTDDEITKITSTINSVIELKKFMKIN